MSITELPTPPSGPAPGSPSKKRGPVTLRRLVISLLLATSSMGLVYAFVSSEDQEPPRIRDAEVLRVAPQPEAFQLRQETIGAQLAPAFTGVLVIDGTEIPPEELRYVDGVNEITYTPGPGTTTGALAPGPHRATIVFWPRSEGREAAERFTWRFNVH